MHDLLPCNLRRTILSAGLIGAAVVGCVSRVSEDRTIQWSDDGKSVAFQHDREGVFVSSNGKLLKIFQPDKDTVATSTPLWSPAGDAVIFTTCKAAPQPDGQPVHLRVEGNAGRVRISADELKIHYTCWLQKITADKPVSKAVKLFEADCDHIDYIAGGLTVRWGPDGGIYHIRQMKGGKHTVFRFDLKSKTSERAFARSGDAIVFDVYRPTKRLICVIGSRDDRQHADGLWIGSPGHHDWWHIAVPTHDAQNSHVNLEELRRMLPVWGPAGSQFAYCRRVSSDPPQYEVCRGSLLDRWVKTLHRFGQRAFDLKWNPGGTRLGAVIDGYAPRFCVLDMKGTVSHPIGKIAVRRFAGWSHDGRMIAWISPNEEPPKTASKTWALLLLPIPRARDTLFVAPTDAPEKRRELFTGMEITFPRWSPTEPKLSFWATYVPTYRGLLDENGRLQPGDPAATIDASTGEVSWMAVNSFEKTQVGHYYLLQGDFQTAARWYDDAAKARASEASARSPDTDRYNRAALFRYYCFKKLDRSKDAARELSQFHNAFAAARSPQRRTKKELTDAERRRANVLSAINRGFFAAEVFLSLNARDEGIRFLQDEVKTARTDADRLGSAVALSQLLVLGGRHDDYAALATKTLFPTFVKLRKHDGANAAAVQSGAPAIGRSPLETATILSLLPLCHLEFQQQFSAESTKSLISRWSQFANDDGDDASRLLGDLVLSAGYRRLGQTADAARFERRIAANPLRTELGMKDGVEELVKAQRQLHIALTLVRQLAERLSGN